MSHVAQVKTNTKIKDLNVLAEACKKIGLQLNLNQKSYKWYGHHVGDYPVPAGFTISDLGKCTHAISIPNNSRAYEIGVVEKNGEYVFLWDFWQGGYGLQDKIGQNGEKLINAYEEINTRNEVKQLADEQGGFMTEYINSNGEQEYKIEIY